MLSHFRGTYVGGGRTSRGSVGFDKKGSAASYKFGTLFSSNGHKIRINANSEDTRNRSSTGCEFGWCYTNTGSHAATRGGEMERATCTNTQHLEEKSVLAETSSQDENRPEHQNGYSVSVTTQKGSLNCVGQWMSWRWRRSPSGGEEGEVMGINRMVAKLNDLPN